MKENMYKNLVEETGYSYSGVVSMMGDKEKGVQLLLELDEQYNDTKKRMLSLEKELEQLKSLRSNQVSLFCYITKNYKTDQLVFKVDDSISIVKMLGDYKIDYEKYKLTEL